MHGLGLTIDGQSFSNSHTGVKGFLLDENLPSRLTFTPSLPVTHASHLGQIQATRSYGFMRLKTSGLSFLKTLISLIEFLFPRLRLGSSICDLVT